MTPAEIWIEEHLDYPHKDWCLIWPFSRNTGGYGSFGADAILAHRRMCECKNGPPPPNKPFAAHSCDRGHDGCVNPHHVSWKTPSENQFDRYKDYRPRPQNKLTPEQVDEIRAMKGRERTVDTASRFQVTEPNIRQIQAGKIWRMNQKNRRIFSREEILLIRSTPHTVKPAGAFAKEFGVGRSVIDRIREYKTYKWVESAEPRSQHPSHHGETP